MPVVWKRVYCSHCLDRECLLRSHALATLMPTLHPSGPDALADADADVVCVLQAEQYRRAYEESERTHQLRNQSEAALKEEVAKQQVRRGEGQQGEVAGNVRAQGRTRDPPAPAPLFWNLPLQLFMPSPLALSVPSPTFSLLPPFRATPFPRTPPTQPQPQALAELCDADVAYLRGVILSGFESGSLPRDGPMFTVLTRLLKVTPQEMQRISSRAPAMAGGSGSGTGSGAAGAGDRGRSGSVLGGASGGLPGLPSLPSLGLNLNIGFGRSPAPK